MSQPSSQDPSAGRASSPLDNAFAVDQGRRSGTTTNIYQALLHSLEPEDRQWVQDVVARHRALEREADARGEILPHAAW